MAEFDWREGDCGIFYSDTAADVRGDFESAIEEGLSVQQATSRILSEYADAIEDVDDGPEIHFALAALQLEHGALQSTIRDRAVAFIEGGETLER